MPIGEFNIQGWGETLELFTPPWCIHKYTYQQTISRSFSGCYFTTVHVCGGWVTSVGSQATVPEAAVENFLAFFGARVRVKSRNTPAVYRHPFYDRFGVACFGERETSVAAVILQFSRTCTYRTVKLGREKITNTPKYERLANKGFTLRRSDNTHEKQRWHFSHSAHTYELWNTYECRRKHPP